MLLLRIAVAAVIARLGGNGGDGHAGCGESEGAGAEQVFHGFNSFVSFMFIGVFMNDIATELSELITHCFK